MSQGVVKLEGRSFMVLAHSSQEGPAQA